MKLKKLKSGFILNEVLLSVALLGTAAIILGSILNNATSTLGMSKNYLIAQNLANEAIEAMETIKNTNYLKCPDQPEKWLWADCKTATSGPGLSSYVIYEQNSQWKLMRVTRPLNLEDSSSLQLTSNNNYRLFIYKMSYSSGLEYYKYFSARFPPSSSPSGGLTATPVPATTFYRSLKFDVIDADNEYATMTVKVQWKQGAQVYKVERQVTFFNTL